MFRCTGLFLCFSLLAVSRLAFADPPRLDPIAENFYPPDLLINHAQEIGLDEQQKQSIESMVRENRQRYVTLQQNLQRQVAALSDILRRDHPDEQEALTQLDNVLAAEREIKRVQLSLSLTLRNQLTPDQQAKVKEVRQKYLSEPRMQQRMEAVHAKMQRLQERIRKLQEDGGDPSAAIQAAQECRQLMQDGKPVEAEAAIDRALAALQSDDKK